MSFIWIHEGYPCLKGGALVFVDMHMPWPMGGGQKATCESWFSLYCVHLGNCAQVLRLGSEHFHPSSHLAGLISSRDIFIPVIDFFIFIYLFFACFSLLFEFYRYFISIKLFWGGAYSIPPICGLSLLWCCFLGCTEVLWFAGISLVYFEFGVRAFLGPYSGNPIPMSWSIVTMFICLVSWSQLLHLFESLIHFELIFVAERLVSHFLLLCKYISCSQLCLFLKLRL